MSRVAVGEYIITSGYFMAEKTMNFSKIVKLEAKVVFYSVLLGGVSLAVKFGEGTVSNVVKTFFPLMTDTYWFFTAYVLFCLFTPILNLILEKYTERTLKISLVIAWGIITVLLKANPFTSGINYMGTSRSVIWFAFLWLVGGTIKKYPIRVSKKVYAIIFVAAYIVIFVSYWMNINWPTNVLLYEDCSILPSLMTISLFVLFKDIKIGTVISAKMSYLATLAFGVYLVQEHCLVREHYWKLFDANKMVESPRMILQFLMAVIIPFLVASLMEFLFGVIWKKTCSLRSLRQIR